MVSGRTFRVVVVRSGVATGLDNASCDREVRYTGEKLTVDLN
jgi:hypothetical protein